MMERPWPTREDAWQLLCEFTRSESLRKHALAVEAAMRAYARRFGEDEERWAIVGLLHDFDYEMHPTPDKHPLEGARILRERGWPEDIVHAVLCHADYLDVERRTPMDRAIYAVDELASFIVAVALVRPHKSIHEVDVAAVRKKMKEKGFARAVDREIIVKGAEVLGVDLDEHIAFVIEALKPVASDLGIAGTEA
ncbi:MAG: HDIG domain-containing protein [Chloroflexota bacterium]|jgi:putative nucleotidyltransferase with HDIG domain|nr:HDIG domain-containing protein [Chloroflexota bacterium]